MQWEKRDIRQGKISVLRWMWRRQSYTIRNLKKYVFEGEKTAQGEAVVRSADNS